MNSVIFRGGTISAILAALFLYLTSDCHAQYTNGIYAEFNTSMGSYTCRLEYALAPKACANFIGLATGQRAWLDLPSGLVKTNPFYDGTTFHRVIAGFMNQGGSRNAQGTDGPGYQFVDEFTPTLRHVGFGVLSMANSGPDSNGSQYFTTVSTQAQLDDVHTVFGRIYGGSNVVYAINHVVTGANDKPLTNVVVNSVVIRRIGTDAQAFDIYTNGLAVVTNLNLAIARTGTNVGLTFSNQLYSDNRLYSSANLAAWSAGLLGIEVTSPVSNAVSRTASLPAQFFRMAQIQYPGSTFAPKQVVGRILTLVFSAGGPGIIVNTFTSNNTGTYNWSLGSPGNIVNYVWGQEPFNATIWPIQYSGIVPMTLKLNFGSATNGTFTGTAYTSPSMPVSGTFTLP